MWVARSVVGWAGAVLLALTAGGCSSGDPSRCEEDRARCGGLGAGNGAIGGVGGSGGTSGIGGMAGGFDNPAASGGSGGVSGTGGTEGVDAGPTTVRDENCGKITAIVRDFQVAHPDFEMDLGLSFLTTFGQGEKNVLKPALENGYPAYAPSGASPGTLFTGPLEFYQWYVDDPTVNQRFEIPLTLTELTPGHFVFESTAFFPIDNMGFGNEGNAHNFHFTTEVRTEFTYKGGEVFTFRGDDDLWMFVNEQTVIDLGGTHGALEATVNMDAEAARLGLVVGETYPMAIFHAERHTSESNFRIETTIECFTTVEPPPPPPPPVVE